MSTPSRTYWIANTGIIQGSSINQICMQRTLFNFANTSKYLVYVFQHDHRKLDDFIVNLLNSIFPEFEESTEKLKTRPEIHIPTEIDFAISYSYFCVVRYLYETPMFFDYAKKFKEEGASDKQALVLAHGVREGVVGVDNTNHGLIPYHYFFGTSRFFETPDFDICPKYKPLNQFSGSESQRDIHIHDYWSNRNHLIVPSNYTKHELICEYYPEYLDTFENLKRLSYKYNEILADINEKAKTKKGPVNSGIYL